MKHNALKWIFTFAVFTDVVILILALIILFESKNLEGTILTFSIEAITLTFSNLISLVAGIFIGKNSKDKKNE